MTHAAKTRIALPVAWLLLTLAHFAFYYDGPLGPFTPLVGWALFLTAIPLALSAAYVGFRAGSKPALAVAALLPSIAIAGWLTPVGRTFGAHSKLWREISDYRSAVAKVTAGADGSEIHHPVTVDPGPPVRVAFSWGGILDNWRGVVYDPTGDVMKANRLDRTTWSNRDDPDYASVAGWFGGTLVRAQHLQGHWYLCWFT